MKSIGSYATKLVAQLWTCCGCRKKR